MAEITTLTLAVDSRQVNTATAALDRFGRAGGTAEAAQQRMERSSLSLGRALSGVTAALSVAQVVRYADAYSSVNARLRLATSSTAEFMQVQSELTALSERQRVSLIDVTNLYARLGQGAKELGATQQTLLKFTEGVGAALIVNGTSATQASGALLQLTQALGGSIVRAEEFNSINEGARPILQAVADNLDGVGGSLSKLRERVNAGELTSRQFFEAFLKGSDELVANAGKIPTTIGQALTIAENRLQAFIGSQSEATGAGRALTGTIDALSKNIDVLASAAFGFAAAKLAETLIGVGAAIQKNVADTLASVAAQKAKQVSLVATAAAEAKLAAQLVVSARAEALAEAQRTEAMIVAARAESALNAAKIAGLEATKAAIVSVRAEAIAKLQSAQASATQAAAQISAAKAAGALSFALAIQREGVTALAAAQARQVALTTELAVLGAQQARVQAGITAATQAQAAASASAAAAATTQAAAQAAAVSTLGGAVARATAAQTAYTLSQRGLAVALGATATAATVASRALALVGGPIGLVTTLLGFGVTAWLLYGNTAKDASNKAADESKRSGREIIADLDEQIAKLERRNALAIQGGAATAIAQAGGADAEELASLLVKINALKAKGNALTGSEQIGLIELQGIYDGILQRSTRFSEGQAKLAAATAGAASKNSLGELLKEYATDAEKLSAALEEARTKLGVLVLPPDLEARIRDRFSAKKITTAREKPDFLGIDLAAIQRELDGLTGAYGRAESILEAQRGAGLVDERSYYQAKLGLIGLNEAAQIRALEAENRRLASERGTNRERLDNLSKIADNEAQIAIIRADAAAQATILGVQQASSARQIAAGFAEAEAAAQDYLDTLQKGQRNQLEGLGLGNQERERRAGRQQIEEQFAQQRLQLESERRRGQISEQQYAQELDRIRRFQGAALSSFDDYYKQLLEKQGSFSVGASEALNNYIAEAEDIAGQTEQLFANAFQGAEDALVKFVQNGKINVRDLLDSIAADIIRVGIKTLISDVLKSVSGIGGAPGGEAAAEAARTAAITASTTALTAQTVAITAVTTAATAAAASLAAVAAAGGASGASSAASGIAGAFSNTDSAAGFASYFGGFFANGGDPPMGKVSVVGENGPELFVPKNRGTIVPLVPAGGGGSSGQRPVNVTVNQSFAAGTDKRTLDQAAAGLGRAVQRATARNE